MGENNRDEYWALIETVNQPSLFLCHFLVTDYNIKRRAKLINNVMNITTMGNVIEEIYLNDRDSKRTIEYEFDERGNWIKSIAYVDGEQQNIIVREIEYL